MKPFMKTVLRIASALVLLVVLLELAARMFGAPQPYSALYAYDPVLGYTFQKGKRATVQEGDSLYTVDFDQNGVVDKAGNDSDIIILGDGVTAGIELKKQDRLAWQLHHLLGEEKGVLNLSVTGYGTIQQVLLLERWLKNGARPNHVVLIFNLDNDVIDNVREWDGQGNPSVHLFEDPVQIHSPVLPSCFYQWVRNIYIESRLFGYLSSQNATNEPPVKKLKYITSLFSPVISNDVLYAMRGLEVALEKLEPLKQQYGFQIHGVIWVDRGVFNHISDSDIDHGIQRVKDLDPLIQYQMFPSESLANNKGIDKWDTSFLVLGARHANSITTRKLSLCIQSML